MAALREGLLDVLARNETLEDFEVNQIFPKIGREFIVRLQRLSADDSLQTSGTKPPSRQLDFTRASRRVLIIDDNEDARRSLVLLVRSWGHEVADAADGASAIERAERFEPDTALVDIGMPGMNGYQHARHFRALPRYGRLQLVAMTGCATPRRCSRKWRKPPFAIDTIRWISNCAGGCC